MTDLSPELQSELIAFVRDYASDKQFIPTNGRAWEAWAKDIAAKLPPPVDPDIEEARKVAAEEQLLENTPNPLRAEQFLSGKFDAEPQIMLALKAIRRGRELERLSISVRHPSPVETAAALRELERSGI